MKNACRVNDGGTAYVSGKMRHERNAFQVFPNYFSAFQRKTKIEVFYYKASTFEFRLVNLYRIISRAPLRYEEWLL